jgi:hypothetical protein
LLTFQDSAPVFFNYISRFKAEKCYFEGEAIPDWRHKAARVDHEHQNSELAIGFTDQAGRKTNFQIWLAVLRNTADKWFKEVEKVEIPDFNETIAAYHLLQAEMTGRIEDTSSQVSPCILLGFKIPKTRTVRTRDTLDSGLGMESLTGTIWAVSPYLGHCYVLERSTY